MALSFVTIVANGVHWTCSKSWKFMWQQRWGTMVIDQSLELS